MYAYEADGLGNHLLMDDANVPSLLSIPYLGYATADDPTYLATRAFALSRANPFHFAGIAAAGVGSPHTPPNHVWPIGVSMQALTTTDPVEVKALLSTLAATTAGTGLMHESFHVDDPATFTRPWFGWANSLFAEAVLSWLL
jgi:meiotically up-regulated gene 157 (Mug157) protein